MIYHKEIGFPETIRIPENIEYELKYTRHALVRKERISKGKICVIPHMARVTKNNLVEMFTDDNKIIKKAVIRTEYNKYQDIVMVLELLPKHKAKVITFWLNAKKDNHYTLNKTKYTQP